MTVPNKQSVDFSDRIFQQEPAFYKLTGRHIGIVGTHAELWCGYTFNLELAATGVSSGADAIATESSPAPFLNGQTVQIKARGSHKTMHITFKTSQIDWLIVITYDLSLGPVDRRVFLFNTKSLIGLANQFAAEFGEPVIPVREMKDGKLRIEWSGLFEPKTGNVRGSTDTWEKRAIRSQQLLAESYSWTLDRFSRLL